MPKVPNYKAALIVKGEKRFFPFFSLMRKSGCARQTRLSNHRNHATQIRSRTIITPACAAAAAAPAHVLHTGSNPIL